MSDEQQVILKMLEEGKITVDEAERLLNALHRSESHPGPPGDFMKGMGSFFEDMGRKFEQVFRHDFSEFFGGDVQEYSVPEETLRFDVGEESQLQMEHRHGTVQITAWDEPAVSIQFTKTVRAESSEKASEILDAIRVKATAEGNVVSVSTLYPENQGLWQGKRRARVNYQIRVPHQTELQLKQEHGDVSIDRLSGSIHLNCRHGNIHLDNADAPVRLESEHGNIILQHLRGDLELHKRHGNVTLRDITSADINHEHGNLAIEGAQGDLKVQRAHGQAQIAQLQGNFDLLQRHGAAQIEVTPPAEGHCRVDAAHANIDLRLINPQSFHLHASTHHGRIDTALTGQLITERLGQELRVGEPEAPLKIELAAHHGNIRIDVKEDNGDE